MLLKIRLCLMIFLQFFIWGAWYATGGNYMKAVGMTGVIYIAYMASPVGSIVSPFFLGMIADRFFPVQRVLGVMHVLSGVFVFVAPLLAEGSRAPVPLFLAALLLHMLCYMPTVGLATAAAFHLLPDKEREFPIVRVFGSLGWIVAGVLVSYVLSGDQTAAPMQVAGVAGILTGLYSFSLPHIPPPAAGKRISLRDMIGLDAWSLLASRSFVVFILSVLLTSVPLATYYAYVPVFLHDAGVINPAFKMTFGQMSEVIFLLLMPWFFIRFGVKYVLLFGMVAWMLRYALFALGAPGAVTWMLLTGIILHGACYDFVYIAGQIYIDRRAPVTIRARAQGLFVLVTYGVGQGLGTLVAGWIFNSMMRHETEAILAQWRLFWIVPLAFASLITALFVAGFREERAVQPGS